MPPPVPEAVDGSTRPWPAFPWAPTDLWLVFLSPFGLWLLAGFFFDEWLGLAGPALAIALVLTHLVAFVLPVAWWLWRRGQPFFRSLALVPVASRDLLLAFIAGLGVFFISFAVHTLTGHAIEMALGRTAQGRDIAGEFPGAWAFAFSAVAILVAPFAEEVLFRGVLFQGLRCRHALGTGVVVSAALFAFAHGELSRIPDLMVSGAAYALMAERSRSLAVPIAAHTASNVLAALLTFG